MNYALIKNGVVENVIVASPEFVSTLAGYDHIEALDTVEEQKVAGPGWLYDADTGLFSAPIPEPSEIDWEITKLAFKNRFPRAKWIAAKVAAQSDPILADFFETFELSTYVDLARQDTIDSVNFLTQESIPVQIRITPEEATAVLTTVPSEIEKPIR